MLPLAIIASLLAFLLIVLYLSARARRTRMNELRAGRNEDTFVQSMVSIGFDPELAQTTYRYLQQTQRVSFPIKPQDLLDEDLGLSSRDVDESVRDLLASSDRLFLPGLAHAPLVTVEDLVRFIQASPRLSDNAAA